MIDLPPGPRPTGQSGTISQSSQTSATTEVRAVDLARQQISQVIAAVVLESKLQQQAGTSQKPVYDILLQANAAPASNPPIAAGANASTNLPAPLTQITPESINILRQGQTILIKTAADFPLQPGVQLLATISPGKGVVLHQILPPQLAATINQALKQLIPQQQSLSPLFRNLEQLAAQTTPGLPKNLQAQLTSLLQLLPRLEQLKTAAQLRSAVNNSGLFLENKIHNALTQAIAKAQASPANKTEASTQGQSASLNQNTLSQSLKELTNRVRAAVGQQQVSSEETATHKTSLDLNQVAKADIKQQLGNLQAHLEKAQASQQSPATQTTQAPPTGPGGAAQVGAKSAAINAEGNSPLANSPATDKTTGKSAEQTVGSYPPARGRNGSAQGGAFVPVNTDTGPARAAPNKVQGYGAIQAATGGSANVDPTLKSTLETYLLPPLPGSIPLQPQARSKPTLGGDMADALVSILLKQVKGALSRITLHQLASQPRNQEPGSPAALLSFELPILHQGQVQIFQFLIEEEQSQADDAEKQLAKRWVVQMAFDIEGLGPMLCQISLVGHTASVSFWAEWENTLQHTKDHFDYLQQVLSDMGLRVEKLQGHLGIPQSEQAVLQNQLVDIRT